MPRRFCAGGATRRSPQEGLVEALEADREDLERGALLSSDEDGTRVRMLPLKGAKGLAARERFEREVAVERDTPPEVTVQ